MIHTLENDRLRIQIADEGAEPVSIFDKQNNREILWQADPAYWKRHAPILFPNVGRNYQDQFRVNGKIYPSHQHGFARDSVFSCTDSAEHSVTHFFTSSEETCRAYPFDFRLSVRHTLEENRLEICWQVQNTGKESMYFTIGGHPAFRVPVLDGTAYADYTLHFPEKDSLEYLLLDPASGTAIPEQIHTLSLTGGSCPLDTHMFDHDALVFDDGQITCAEILLPDKTPYLQLRCDDFPNFGIWSVPGAPFVCLEPWAGRTDNCGFEGELSEKPGINALNAGETFEKSYTITVF